MRYEFQTTGPFQSAGDSFLSPKGSWDEFQTRLLNSIKRLFSVTFKLCFRSQDEASEVKKSHSRHVTGYGLQVTDKSFMTAFI